MKTLKIYRYYLTKSDCYKKAYKQQPIGVQVHSTGANNSYLKRYVQPDDGRLGKNPYNNSHNKPGLDVCANAYIGKLQDGTVAIYQTLPWNYRCWLSGKGPKGNANRLGYIGFEICEDNLSNKAYFDEAVMTQSVLLVAYLCLTYNIPIENVRDHHELHAMGLASGHADISHWLKRYYLTMDDYRAAVKKAMEEGVTVKYIEPGEMEQTMNEAEVFASNGYPVKMREYPNTSSEILALVPVGAQVEVLGIENKEWTKICYNEQVGYMMSKFLIAIPQDTPAAKPDEVVINRVTLEQIKASLTTIIEIIDQLLKT